MEQRQLIAETDIATSIIASGIADEPVTHLVEGAMQRLVLAGVPLHRMQVGFRILHPLFDGMSVTWTEEGGVSVTYYDHIDVDGSEFRLSPFYYMLSNGLTELRLRLDRDPAAERFPVLMDFKAKGVTDYLALIVSFGGAPMTPETHEGLGTSWSTRGPSGFSDPDIAAMRQVLAPLALALRVVIKDQITRNTLNTFHGPLVGGRILSGLIKRGAGERLAAALWYSDLRNSTGLADALPVEAFLDLLNVYFDCAAGAVMEEGGHVLDIIGDAILAFFPASASSDAEACASAVRAASKAQARLAALKAQGNARAQEISFGVGIHFGDMVFGNAGTPERLKFGVIGRAVNEVARTADMAKLLKREVVVSDAVASRLASRSTSPASNGNGSATGHRLSDLGEHELRGIPSARRLWPSSSLARQPMPAPAEDQKDHPDVVIFPPVLLLATLALGIILEQFFPLGVLAKIPTAARLIMGALLLLAGLAQVALTKRAFTGAGTNIRPDQPTTALVTSGLFAHVRNPAYQGGAIMLLGLAFLLNSDWLVLLAVPMLLVLHYGVVLREEQYLEKKFGEPYRAYKARVPRYGWKF